MGLQGQGFSKRQPVKMTVNAEDVQRMQQGYEGRLAQQIQIINRLQGMLQGRTDQLAFQMQEENRRAAEWGVEPDQVLMVPVTEQDDDFQLIWTMIPKEFLDDYDAEYLKSAPKGPVIQSYIRHLQGEVIRKSGTRLAEQLEGSERARLAGERKLANVQAQLDEANRNLAQAIADARNNAKVANQAFQQVPMDDDTPPWEKPGFVPPSSSVAPTVLERNTPVNVAPDPVRDGESETIQFNGFASNTLPMGEQRPGGF